MIMLLGKLLPGDKADYLKMGPAFQNCDGGYE